jgi:hypothetical protein
MSAERLVDVHIEKTAGRTKRKVLINAFGADNVLHYDSSTDRLIRANRRLHASEKHYEGRIESAADNPLLNPIVKLGYMTLKYFEKRRTFAPEALPADFGAITGHFVGDRFVQQLPPEEHFYTSVLRNPLERSYSHYQHWLRTRGLARFRIMPPFDSRLAFEDFARLPGMQNYQSVSLGIPKEAFRLIGVMDHLPEYFEELGLPLPNDALPHLNEGSYSGLPPLDADFVHEFIDQNSQDYELYESVMAHWA